MALAVARLQQQLVHDNQQTTRLLGEAAELEQQVEDAEALELPRVPTGKVEQRVREEEAPAAEASAQPAAAEAEQPEPQLVPA